MERKPGKVVQLLNEFEVVANLGTQHRVVEGEAMTVFAVGDEVRDPDTGENLGRLEIPRGRGVVIHVQDKMCVIRSTETKRVVRDRIRSKLLSPMSIPGFVREPLEYVQSEEEEPAPFRGAQVGDCVRTR